MPSPSPSFDYGEIDRATEDRLRKLATETDLIEGYKQPHSLRFAQLAEAVGQSLGLHSLDLQALKLAALAHDLGERKMRREYLQRPSALNWEEQLDLWRHPIIGEQEAQELKLPRQAQLLVRWHHEWWNGTGYPDGLAATAIPLGARILRVVDTYCALTSERPYRGAYDHATAEQMLADQAGIECDPRVVKALLTCLAEERLAQEQKAAAEQSYETVPMEVVRVESENEASSALPATEEFQAVTSAEPIELAAQPSADEMASSGLPVQAESAVAPVTDQEVPAPPMPPPSPLWTRFTAHEDTPAPQLESLPDASPTLSVLPTLPPLDDSPEAETPTPSAFGNAVASEVPVSVAPPLREWSPANAMAPTEEVPALTAADLLNATRDEVANDTPPNDTPTIELTEPEPPPAPVSAEPVPVSLNNQLQVLALSEVPDHFWLIAKWIYEEWWATPDNSISLVSNPLKEHLTGAALPQTFVALIDGKPVGCISLIERELAERPEHTPWLSSLYVLPPYREQGIGTRLLEGAFFRAKLQGAEAVYLATPGHTEFFTRLGWQVLERDVGPRRLLIMMRMS